MARLGRKLDRRPSNSGIIIPPSKACGFVGRCADPRRPTPASRSRKEFFSTDDEPRDVGRLRVGEKSSRWHRCFDEGSASAMTAADSTSIERMAWPTEVEENSDADVEGGGVASMAT